MERWRIVLINRKTGIVKVHYAINIRLGNIFIWVLPSIAEDEIPYNLSKWNCKEIIRVTKTEEGYKSVNKEGFIV